MSVDHASFRMWQQLRLFAVEQVALPLSSVQDSGTTSQQGLPQTCSMSGHYSEMPVCTVKEQEEDATAGRGVERHVCCRRLKGSSARGKANWRSIITCIARSPVRVAGARGG